MKPAITDIVGIGPAATATLAEHGFKTLASVARSTVEKLAEVPGFSEARAAKVIAAASELLPAKAAPASAKGNKDKDKKKDKKGKKGKDKKKDKKGKKNKKGKGKKK
jgi:hypothetical protein